MLASLLSLLKKKKKRKEKKKEKKTNTKKKKKEEEEEEKGHQHRPIIVQAIRDFGYEDTVCIAKNKNKKQNCGLIDRRRHRKN